ncbi:hypothetical protein C2E31_07655 [Rhodopirellula baltica]|nr:hypothetical protein C2E31_07655 [Rhodopirellula baltica]
MVDQLVRRSLDHPKRRWVVWGITLFLLLFVTLPCWDHYGDRQSEVRSLSTELYEATLASNNVAAMQSRLAQLGTQDGQQNLFFDQDRAEQFRESVTEITFDLQCQLKRLTLSDPRQTPWVPSQGLVQMQR